MLTERIDLIIDGIDKRNEYQNSIDFVHSFGLKCDSVGWCKIDLKSEKDFELLKEIKAKAKSSRGRVRVCYTKKESDIDTDWYILKPSKKIEIDYDDFNNPKGFKAYKLSPNTHMAYDDSDNLILVDDEVAEFIKDYCPTAYIYDNGRFAAKSFNILMPRQYVKHACTIIDGSKAIYKELDFYSGNLSRIAELVNTVQLIDFPTMIAKDDELTDSVAYIPWGKSSIWEYVIKKELAEKLLEKGFVKKNELIPVRYCDKKNHKHLIKKFNEAKFFSNEIFEKWSKDKAKLEMKNRPAFEPTEKLALQELRKAKKERNEDFNRALSKTFLERIEDNLMLSISPIYKLSNGFYLNEEIEILQYNEIDRATNEFFDCIKQEEMIIDEMPELLTAKKIGRVANGDSVLIIESGEVIIFDHEEPNNSIKFSNIWHFIYENIE